ncbi:MAG: SRPBCC family protein [Chloroflexi bacterium]|nr:SRPBCC family protein [Chloroflexota bacterium]
MIDFEIGTLIDRPVEAAFAFLSNPLNLPRWQSMLAEIKPVATGPVGVGSKFSTKGERLGRKIDGLLEITEFEPPVKFGYKGSAGPMQVHGLITLKPAGTGARVLLKAHAEPGGMFKLAEGLLANQVKSQMEANLDRLKAVLEAGA